MTERVAFETLQAENARLVALLESHGIAWRAPPAPTSQPALTACVHEPAPVAVGPSLSTAEKLALFRRLFRGRTDVYPVRWEGKTSGKSGYAPACANEWRAGVCEKPRIKCGDCSHRLLMPLTDSVIYDHLAGKQTVGVADARERHFELRALLERGIDPADSRRQELSERRPWAADAWRPPTSSKRSPSAGAVND